MNAEKTLGKKLKQLSVNVANQRMEIDKQGTKQFLDNTMLGEKRRELTRVQHEISLAKEKERRYMRDITESEKERNILKKEIEDIQKQKMDLLQPELMNAVKTLKVRSTDSFGTQVKPAIF